MSSVPVGWLESPLAGVCEPVVKIDPQVTRRQEIRYVDIGSVDGGTQRLIEAPVISAATAPTRARQVLRSGDTVFSTVRPYLRKIAYIDDSLDDEFASTGFTVLRPGPRLLPRYLFHFTTSQGFLSQVLPHQRGVSYPAVRDKDVLASRIPVPPLDEQQRIVAILEGHLSRLDDADTGIHRLRRRLLTLRASGRLQAFDHLLRVGVATERALLEVAVIANGQTPKGLNDLAVEPDEESVPFFKVGDMNASGGRYMSTARTYLSRLGIQELGLAVRPSGTVLIPKRGGAIATNKKRILSSAACYDLNTMGFIPGPEVLGEYLWHWLETVDLGRLADGSNVPQINAPQIRALVLPIPPLDEQRRLVEELDDVYGAVGRLDASLSGARSTALRRALLTAAFTDRLTGRATDDEVVEELADV